MKARNQSNFLQEIISLLDAKQFNLAHRLLLVQLPRRIICENLNFMKIMLENIPGDLVRSWKIGGGFVLQYIKITNLDLDDSMQVAGLPEEIRTMLDLLSHSFISQWQDIIRDPSMNNLIKQCVNHIGAALFSILIKLEPRSFSNVILI